MLQVIVIAVTLLTPGFGYAQSASTAGSDWPAKPIRVIVASVAGSAMDIAGRQIGQPLAKKLGQPVIVDNRGGASGSIAAQLVIQAPADGYTLLLGANSGFTIFPILSRAARYDTLTDFVPVSLLVTSPYVLVAHPQVPARNAKELIALAKANAGRITYASAGNASLAHLTGELFAKMAGIKLNHVPYKSSAQSVIDVVNGSIDVLFGTISPTLPFIRSGKLRALGVTSKARVAALADVPPMAETGVRDFDVSFFLGIIARSGTPGSITSRLNREISSILKSSEIRESFAAQGMEAKPDTPGAFGALLGKEAAMWRDVIKTVGIREE